MKELKDLYEDSENKITDKLQKREAELKSLKGQLAKQTEQFHQLKGGMTPTSWLCKRSVFA
ncbi:MAG: hypothetical protein KZQ56_13110 [gamma proteobacterium symbiont of Lucinoma myriamae]|nr:hypothetical protein [gamma proteobacterium symbiont of Lucinoma myriamae]MCU7833490.1 hypothetical protein [gamma proteobacterium symbiont of Lucinoma myriamae]